MPTSSTKRWLKRIGALVFWLVIVGALGAGAWAFYTQILEPDVRLLAFDYKGQEIKLLEPRALGLLLLVPLIPAMHYFTLNDFPWGQKVLNSLLRVSIIVAIVAALVRPSISRYDSKLCVVYAVDVSASMPDASLEQAQAVIQEALDARGQDLLRLVTFAAHPEVIPIGTTTTQIPTLERHEEALSSNPAAALRLSYGLCPQDHLQRVVLMTDGNQNRGDLIAEAANAAEFGVRVYTHELEIAPAPEVMVRDLELPSDIELSEPFVMTAEVYSNRATTARYSLQQNEFRDIRGREVTLEPGVNRIDMTVEVYEPGQRHFTFEISPDEEDHFGDNNQFERTVTVEGRPRVLYVEGESRSRSYLQRALDRDRNDLANFDLEVRGAHGFPTSLDEMANFDMIIMSDVNAQYVSRTAMNNIERYVRDLGGGFLMAGGEDSFGPGGFDNTPLEELSPVTFDMQRMREMPSLAIMLVIDRSGSMDGLKLEMAKEAARAVVDMLGPQDYVGVIAFDTMPQTVVRLQSATNRARIRSDIGRIGSGGGTDILPGLEEAYLALLAQPARLKHVIVLTDGQAPWTGISDLTGAMRADGMTVSSVAVGGEADRSLLEMIADIGGGRFYQTNNPSNIPQIFVQETSQVARTNLVEEPFRPQVVGRSQALRGIDWDNAPYLLGYVTTQPRSRARVLLETERGEPLLAEWRQGLGRVAVWTSDVKNRWSVEWVRERIYPRFWAQLIRDMMRVESEEELAMTARIEEGVARIEVNAIGEDDRFINGLVSMVTLRGPDGDRIEAELIQTAAGRYEAQIPLDTYGSYELEAEHTLDGHGFAVSRASLTYPYPDEYQSFEPTFDLARRASALSFDCPPENDACHISPTPDELYDAHGEETEFRKEFWQYGLWAALLLVIFDLLFRRIRLFAARFTKWGKVIGEA